MKPIRPIAQQSLRPLTFWNSPDNERLVSVDVIRAADSMVTIGGVFFINSAQNTQSQFVVYYDICWRGRAAHTTKKRHNAKRARLNSVTGCDELNKRVRAICSTATSSQQQCELGGERIGMKNEWRMQSGNSGCLRSVQSQSGRIVGGVCVS